ncbi:MAG: 50S ribosomal protein L4 [Dehalococcoidales bacterium]|nr:50S ribosomal protein L4 [Dehalococcoidales bacterium]
MQIPVYSMAGEVIKQIDISDDVFTVPFNQSVVHQAVVRQLANARHGNACTKTRGEVTGSNKKLFRQKHTGNARAGNIKSPLRRGGGIVFGPKPRNYKHAIPKKMRRLAIRSVLSAKLKDNELIVLEDLNFNEPKTREMARVLSALNISASTLIATNEIRVNVIKSVRNLPDVKTIPAGLLNVRDMTSHKVLLMTEAAVRQVEQIWGEERG